MSTSKSVLIETITGHISDSEVLTLLKSENRDWNYLQLVKEYTHLKDDLLSDWLNISVKTFRSYKKQDLELKENIKEQAVLLLSLFIHGVELFGTQENFYNWLSNENFFLDGEKPVNFLKTSTGIRFIDDRLTAMEYGDNV